MSSECFGMVDADIILRSADGREFRVHKSMLSITSPIFRDMFTFLQPHPPEPSSILVVEMYDAGTCSACFSNISTRYRSRSSRTSGCWKLWCVQRQKLGLEDGGRGVWCARGTAGSPEKLTLGKISSAFMEGCVNRLLLRR